MKRSRINDIMAEADEMIRSYGFVLPPFARWTPEDFKARASEARHVIDGHAPDGTPEAIYIEGAPGFSLSVQWHPEWNACGDPVSRPLFEAFGQAAYAWAEGERRPHLKSA